MRDTPLEGVDVAGFVQPGQSLPKLVALANTYPTEKVRMIAVNQEELPFIIQQFLAVRDLDMEVGVDADASIGEVFGVNSLPQTVIVGPGGKVARVFVGAPADLHTSIQQAINELLPPSD